MGAWVLLGLASSAFLALCRGASAIYIVQTADNRFHFISGQVDVFPIPFHSIAANGVSERSSPYGLRSVSAPDASVDGAGIGDMSGLMKDGRDFGAEGKTGAACLQCGLAGDYALRYGRRQAVAGDASRGVGRPDESGAAHAAADDGMALVDRKKSRIDDVFLTDAGYVVYQGHRIPLTLLYATPFFRDGISIMATNRHFPYIINNTFVVVASVQINIYDIVYLSKRDIEFNYVVYWEEAFHRYLLRGNRIKIDGQWHEFAAQVLAVFEARSCGGLFYMVRLFNTPGHKDGVQDFSDVRSTGHPVGPGRNLCDLSYIQGLSHQSHINSIGIVAKEVISGGIVRGGTADCTGAKALEVEDLIRRYGRGGRSYLSYAALAVILCCFFAVVRKRSLRCRGRVAEGVHAGVFIDQPCLIYQVRDTEEPARIRDVKHHGLVHVLRADRVFGIRLFCRRVVATEPTDQYLGCAGEDGGFRGPAFRDVVLCFVRTIEFLHSRERVHGRICPENFRIAEHGSPKVQFVFDSAGWGSPEQVRSAGDRKYRPTEADDIFSLGCVIHYYITGHHPFGGPSPKSVRGKAAPEGGGHVRPNRPPRGCGSVAYFRVLDSASVPRVNQNILERLFFIRIEDRIAHDLVYHCIFTRNIAVSRHPFFWDWQKRAEMVCDVSDFVEGSASVKARMEASKDLVFRGLWSEQLDEGVVSGLGKKRTYDGASFVDLIRIIRNTHRHYNELQNREFYEQHEGRVVGYYMSKFPKLFMVLHKCRAIANNEIFEKYY